MQPETNVVIALEPQPVYNLPFPAITICPETKAQKSMINFTDAYTIYQSGEAEGHFSDEE
jgi:acid-sensing ion channel, other